MKRRYKVKIYKFIRLVGKLIYKRHVWLVSDREFMAGDNGEAFFRYLVSNHVDAVFAIKKNCNDYDRFAKIGEVVAYDSLAHQFCYSSKSRQLYFCR